MAPVAQYQVRRIIALVAWLSQRDSQEPVDYPAVASELGVSEATVRGDLQVLLDLTDGHKDWLSSLSVMLTANGVTLSSRGPFRRPLRLTRDEGLALMAGLAGLPGGRPLAERLGAAFGAATDDLDSAAQWGITGRPRPQLARMLAAARTARDERRRLELLYCGSGGEPSRRVVQVHQVVQGQGAWYLVAWCERARAARHFRVERILELQLLDGTFEPRPELRRVKALRDLLSAERPSSATIAFSPRIARWMREKYPGGREQAGRYLVELPVADPHWLAREVLQYGAEAELLEPRAMREYLGTLLGSPTAGN
jgi:predicted DNA-binding transcriptional regulator YafY